MRSVARLLVLLLAIGPYPVSAATIFATSNTKSLSTVDTVSGATFDFPGHGFSGSYPAAFDPTGTILYTIKEGLFPARALAIFDTGTGGLTAVGAGLGAPTSNTTALEVGPDGTIYVGDFGGQVYTVDPTTGVATTLGPTGAGLVQIWDMSFDPGGTLWATGNNKLWTIDPSTGAATFVTNLTGLSPELVWGIMFDASGTLFALSDGPVANLYTIDPATGVATFVTGTGLAFGRGGDIWFALATLARSGKIELALPPPPVAFTARTSNAALLPIAAVLDDSRGRDDAGLGGLIASLDDLSDQELGAALAQLSPVRLEGPARATLSSTRDYHRQLSAYLAKDAGQRRFEAASPVRHETLLQALGSVWPWGIPLEHQGMGTPPATLDVAAAPWGHWNAFLESFGGYGSLDAHDDRLGQRSWTAGAFGGMDYRFSENTVAGLSAGYGYTDTSARGDPSSGDAQSIRVGPYASHRRGAWHLDGAMTGAYHWIENERNVGFAGFSRTADSDHGAWDIAAHSTTRLDLDWGPFRFGPVAGLQYVHLEEDAFEEGGAGSANLRVGDNQTDSLRSRVGIEVAYQVPTDQVGLQFDGEAGWSHEYMDDGTDLNARFASAPGTGFRVSTAAADEDAIYYGIGARVDLGESSAIHAELRGERSSHVTEHFVTLRFELRF